MIIADFTDWKFINNLYRYNKKLAREIIRLKKRK